MSDVDIIAAIDAVTGCQQCGRTLEGSVSDDFCGERCQRTWAANRVGAPVVHDSVHTLAGCSVEPILNSADLAALSRMFVQLMPTAEQCSEAFRRFGEALRREDDQPFQRLYLNQPRRSHDCALLPYLDVVSEHVDQVADELNVPCHLVSPLPSAEPDPSEHAQ